MYKRLTFSQPVRILLQLKIAAAWYLTKREEEINEDVVACKKEPNY